MEAAEAAKEAKAARAWAAFGGLLMLLFSVLSLAAHAVGRPKSWGGASSFGESSCERLPA